MASAHVDVNAPVPGDKRLCEIALARMGATDPANHATETIGDFIRRNLNMKFHNLLTLLAMGAGGAGMAAEAVVGERAPDVGQAVGQAVGNGGFSWPFALCAMVPAATLALRILHSIVLRYFDSKERLAMISRGIAPGPLPGESDPSLGAPVATAPPAATSSPTPKPIGTAS